VDRKDLSTRVTVAESVNTYDSPRGTRSSFTPTKLHLIINTLNSNSATLIELTQKYNNGDNGFRPTLLCQVVVNGGLTKHETISRDVLQCTC